MFASFEDYVECSGSGFSVASQTANTVHLSMYFKDILTTTQGTNLRAVVPLL
ncbi:hypothetical protein ES702_02412 [subsurface metagenome]